MRDYATISKRLRQYSENCVAYKLDADFANAVTDAADAIEELNVIVEGYRSRIRSGSGWISMEERLPEINQSVLICAFGRSVGEGTYRGHDGFHHVWKMYAVAGTYWDDEVTHWMPLPAPPKGVE